MLLLVQVLQCFREGPTACSRQCMFSIIYDYITDGQVRLLLLLSLPVHCIV